ncbi:MAG: hypothetical protein PHH00_02365 [Candidatus Nanoarchaeia archaeon]|nr:hypothetical protein [Candidatus Nanoarchaeia archaeon]
MDDNFSDERIEELGRIISMTDKYLVRGVPDGRVNEILWRLKPTSPCIVEMQPSMNGKSCYYLSFTNLGVMQHA